MAGPVTIYMFTQRYHITGIVMKTINIIIDDT